MSIERDLSNSSKGSGMKPKLSQHIGRLGGVVRGTAPPKAEISPTITQKLFCLHFYFRISLDCILKLEITKCTIDQLEGVCYQT